MLRARVAIGALVRDGLAQLGVDPARAHGLRLADEAASRLASLGETPEPRQADLIGFPSLRSAGGARKQFAGGAAPGSDGSTERFTAKIAHVMGRYDDGREPDFAAASLAELFAWCLARLSQGA